ncbi:MAG: putative transcriptional regulatory protein [Bacteroidota bacterium]|nr:putative transcriptional regulatory protein [Bacteroidota bacterium]
MSGHSKWANIKHRKGRQDAKRGKVFTSIAKEITISAREGGGDPDGNPRLRLAVQNARAVNMPSDNIKRAILKGIGELEGVTYEEITYEGYAPSGVAVIVETATDNRKRTVAEIRALFGRMGGNLGEAGSVSWNFDRKGVISFKTNGASEEELLELVIESGADDLEYDEEASRVICPFEQLMLCTKYLMDLGKDIVQSKFEYLPKTMVNISDVNEGKKILKFIEAVEDQEDVQNIFYNLEIDDSIADQMDE